MPKAGVRPILAVDIDEVLVPYTEGLVMYHNKKYGTKLRFEEVVHHNFGEFWGVSHEEYLRRAWQYIIDNHEVAVPLDGAKEAISKLAKRYDLHLITFRSPPLKPATLLWLQKHFDGYFSEPVFLGNKEGAGAHRRTKAEVCQAIGASYLIDDHLSPVIEAAGCGVKGILFGDYPWNQAKQLPPNVRHAKDWPSVLEVLV